MDLQQSAGSVQVDIGGWIGDGFKHLSNNWGKYVRPYLTFFGGRLFMGSGSYIEGVRTRREALPQYLRGWPRTWEVKVATRVRLPSAATGSRFAQTDHSV